jgi:hypothetical protein
LSVWDDGEGGLKPGVRGGVESDGELVGEDDAWPAGCESSKGRKGEEER